MTVKSSPLPSGNNLIIVLIFAAGFLSVSLFNVIGQTRQTTRSKSGFPRVGEIRNYEKASPKASGCGNHLIGWKQLSERYVFMSEANGKGAWMHLNGRDVPLQLVKSTFGPFNAYGSRQVYHQYLAGTVRITVGFPDLTDYISVYRVTITLRKDGLVQMFRAFGAAECD